MDTYEQIKHNRRMTVLLVMLFPLSLILLIGLASFAFVSMDEQGDIVVWGLELLDSFYSLQKINQSSLSLLEMRLLATSGFVIYVTAPLILISAAWLVYSYYFGYKMVISSVQAVPLPRREEYKKVYQSVENVAIMAGIPTPKVMIIESDALNAFTTGNSPQTAIIALTTGIINKLSPAELQGVIAHETGHIVNRDILLQGMVISGIGIFTILLDILRLFLRTPMQHRGKKDDTQKALMFFLLLIYIVLAIFAFVIAPLIKLAISRNREYLADSTGALLTRDPLSLATALEKISQNSNSPLFTNHPLMEIACIESPVKMARNLSSTHPPIDDRISRLYKMAGKMKGI